MNALNIKSIVFLLTCFVCINIHTNAQDAEKRLVDLKVRIYKQNQLLGSCKDDPGCKHKYGPLLTTLMAEYRTMMIHTKAQFGFSDQPVSALDAIQEAVPADWAFLPLNVRFNFSREIKRPGEGYIAYELSYADNSEVLGALAYKPGTNDFVIWAGLTPMPKGKVTTFIGTERSCEGRNSNTGQCTNIKATPIPMGPYTIILSHELVIHHTDTVTMWTGTFDERRNFLFKDMQLFCSTGDLGYNQSSFHLDKDTSGQFFFTEEMYNSLVQTKSFNKTYRWSNEKGTDNRMLTIDMEVGDILFDPPKKMEVSPAQAIQVKGPGCKGTYEPSTITYTVKNPGKTAIQFTAATDAQWLSVSPPEGEIIPGQSIKVDVKVLPEKIPNKKKDTYKADIKFVSHNFPDEPLIRTINLKIDSLWCWQLSLYGFEEWLWREGFSNNTKSIRMGFRYRFDIVVDFYLEKMDGFWIYKEGKYKKYDVRFKNLCDETYLHIISQKANWGRKKANYTDMLDLINQMGLAGRYDNSDKTIRFNWMEKAHFTTYAKIKYTPSKDSKINPVFSRDFMSEYFFTWARDHLLALMESIDGKSQEFYKEMDYKNGSGSIHLISEYRLVQLNKKP